MMRITKVLVVMVAVIALAACGSDKKNTDAQTPPPGASTFLASGGTSTSGTGGTGGYVNVQSYGAVKVLRSGTVDTGLNATAPASVTAVNFGAYPFIVSSGTMTVLLDTDESDVLCAISGDPNLYIGDGDGVCDGSTDTQVTGLTIDAGATLVLADQGFGYATLRLTDDLVINGTLTADVNATWGLDIEADQIIVGSGGMMTQSAMTMDTQAGEIWLGSGSGMITKIINRGTVEARGLGTGGGGYMYFYANDLIENSGTIDASGGSSAAGPGGNGNEIDIYLNSANNGKFYSSGSLFAKGGDSTDTNGGNGGTGGYIYIDVPDLVVNTGVVDVSGGNSDIGSGGSGGEFDVYVNYGDFHSSGTVRMNGGNGATNGGDTEAWNGYWYGYSAYIETAYNNNDRGRNGEIIISGTWEANGGNGGNGSGGYGGDIYFAADAMGAVTINAVMSARGGSSSEAGFSGGSSPYGIEIYSFNYHGDPANPGKIRIAGQYDLRGGNGDESGGSGGYLNIGNYGYNAANIGSAVELVGFPLLIMNGGDGANGGSANSSAFQLYTNSPNGVAAAGAITSEANIEAKGGNGAETAGSYGGVGGNVYMTMSGISDPSEVITNSGNIDVSGGYGYTSGGSGSTINLNAQHVTTSGKLTSNGGNVTTGATFGAGSGGTINLNSSDSATPTTYSLSDLSIAGGTPDGGLGYITVDGGAII